MSMHERTAMLLGEGGLVRLRAARVAVFGVGGVGGYAAEALARSGVGAIDVFDDDRVVESNLNRQIIATRETLGQEKVQAMAERIRSIAPDCAVTPHRLFYLPETADSVDLSVFSYVIDCVDTVAAKLELIERARRLGVPVISAMGAGNKLDPTLLQVADIEKTSVCPLARVMRRELRKRGVRGVKVVYSQEEPINPAGPAEPGAHPHRATPGSAVFVPGAMGLALAAEVVRELAQSNGAGD